MSLVHKVVDVGSIGGIRVAVVVQRATRRSEIPIDSVALSISTSSPFAKLSIEPFEASVLAAMLTAAAEVARGELAALASPMRVFEDEP